MSILSDLINEAPADIATSARFFVDSTVGMESYMRDPKEFEDMKERLIWVYCQGAIDQRNGTLCNSDGSIVGLSKEEPVVERSVATEVQ